MKRSLFFATLVLFFGIAIGCSEKKKGAAAPAPPPTPCVGSDCNSQCYADEVYDHISDTCIANHIGNYQLYDELNVTNGTRWEEFLEAYTNSAVSPSGFWCRDNENDGISYWAGKNACSTYDYNRTITLNISSLVIAENDTTQANLILTAKSGYGIQIESIYLPLSTGTMTAKQYGSIDGDTGETVPGAGFQLSTTLHGPNGPKQFIMRGNKVDMTADNGLKVKLYYGDPGNILNSKFAEAVLYVY